MAITSSKVTGKGIGIIASSDFLASISWTGKTKDGCEVKITVKNAINLDNIDWTLADKDDVIASVTFVGCYDEGVATEPWDITYVNPTAGTGSKKPENIILGAGIFKIGDVEVGLTRGGGKFTVERTYRNIEADGDAGTVKGRVMLDGSTPKLQMNLLTIINNIASLHPSISVAPVTA